MKKPLPNTAFVNMCVDTSCYIRKLTIFKKIIKTESLLLIKKKWMLDYKIM